MRLLCAVLAGIFGVAFFFAIIGVFGQSVAIGSLLLFVVIALVSFRLTAGRQS